MITITMDDSEVRGYLQKLSRKTSDMSPAMRGMGELLVASTKERFTSGKAPDGTPWAPNKATTINAFLQDKGRKKDKLTGKKGNWKKGYTRKGRLSAKSWGIIGAKRPLIGHTRRLGSHIHYRATKNSVFVGSSLVYSAVQHFGAQKGSLGRTRRGGPVPWGDIPARNYLGLSAIDRHNLIHYISRYLK